MKRGMLRVWLSVMLMGALLLPLTACTTPSGDGGTTTPAVVTTAEPPPVVEPPRQGDISDAVTATVVKMDSTFQTKMEEAPLNAVALENDHKYVHIPVVRLSTLEERNAFMGSTQKLPVEADSPSFYQENALLLVAIESGSGSYKFAFKSAVVENKKLTVRFEREYHDPDLAITTDLANWMGTVILPSELLAGITEIDAVLSIETLHPNVMSNGKTHTPAMLELRERWSASDEAWTTKICERLFWSGHSLQEDAYLVYIVWNHDITEESVAAFLEDLDIPQEDVIDLMKNEKILRLYATAEKIEQIAKADFDCYVS